MSYAPGPWHRNIPPAAAYPVICGDDARHVAIVEHRASRGARSAAEIEANASLIAAAPELLAAVQRQVANIEHWLATGEAAGGRESREIYAQLRAAMNKATDTS